MKRFFLASAIVEVTGGLTFVIVPQLQAAMLFGATLDGPGATALARLLGFAMTTIGLACWFARRDVRSAATRGLVIAMLLYNTSAVVLALAAAFVSRVSTVGLWPGAAIHAAMAAWSVVCLRRTPNARAAEASQ